jgi:hypothetical protein
MQSVCTPFEPSDHLTDFHPKYVLVSPLLILIISGRADGQTCESGAELAAVLGTVIMYVKIYKEMQFWVGNVVRVPVTVAARSKA